MSALPPKADIIPHCIKCPLIAKSGHWWANENGGSGRLTAHLKRFMLKRLGFVSGPFLLAYYFNSTWTDQQLHIVSFRYLFLLRQYTADNINVTF